MWYENRKAAIDIELFFEWQDLHFCKDDSVLRLLIEKSLPDKGFLRFTWEPQTGRFTSTQKDKNDAKRQIGIPT